jgi:hypothetical protein
MKLTGGGKGGMAAIAAALICGLCHGDEPAVKAGAPSASTATAEPTAKPPTIVRPAPPSAIPPVSTTLGTAPTRIKADDFTKSVPMRLRPSEKTLEANHGLAGYVMKNRGEPLELLQLVNPFAPAAYGKSGREFLVIEDPVARASWGSPKRPVSDTGILEAQGVFLSW